MGTRSTVHFIDEYTNSFGKATQEVVLSVYQQFDGYPEGVGATLVKFLASKKLVNGIPCRAGKEELKKMANGIGCLALQYVCEIKRGIGAVYATDMNDRQEYNYFVIGKSSDDWDAPATLSLSVVEGDNPILFHGTVTEALESPIFKHKEEPNV